MSETPADEPLLFKKSTRSAANGNCVEVAQTATGIAIRDSKDQQGPVLRFDREAWHGFLGEVKAGDFEGPASR